MTHNVPEGVAYGTVHGEFMSFAADMAGTAAGPDGVPDKIPMEGYVVLTPQVETVRWPSLVPPITAVIQDVRCPLIEGKLYPPGTAPEYAASVTPGVVLVATEQPEALPSTVQYTLTFDLKGIKRQPNPVTFEVPSGGVVDLTTVIPATPVPGTVVVVSAVDRERAEAAAVRAEEAAVRAEQAEGGGGEGGGGGVSQGDLDAATAGAITTANAYTDGQVAAADMALRVYADGKASSEAAAALAAAKADATSKADAAQVAAEAKAATAQATADTAQSTADTAQSTADTARAEATQKAAAAETAAVSTANAYTDTQIDAALGAVEAQITAITEGE